MSENKKVKLVIDLANIPRGKCETLQQIESYQNTVRAIINEVIKKCGEGIKFTDGASVVVPIEKLECVKEAIENANYRGKIIREIYY